MIPFRYIVAVIKEIYMELLNTNVSLDEFNYLMQQQAKGKRLKVINNKVVAVDYEFSQDETQKNELNNLKQWFNNIYQYQEQKYRRLHTLQQLCDNGASPYDMLIELYKEAEVKRKRIQELEVLINEQVVR